MRGILEETNASHAVWPLLRFRATLSPKRALVNLRGWPTAGTAETGREAIENERLKSFRRVQLRRPSLIP